MAAFHPPYWIIDQSQSLCPPHPPRPAMAQNSHFYTTVPDEEEWGGRTGSLLSLMFFIININININNYINISYLIFPYMYVYYSITNHLYPLEPCPPPPPPPIASLSDFALRGRYTWWKSLSDAMGGGGGGKGGDKQGYRWLVMEFPPPYLCHLNILLCAPNNFIYWLFWSKWWFITIYSHYDKMTEFW